MTHIVPVIMCGGAGTRLWPGSRESMPKQFMPLFGDHSTFQSTVLRVSGKAAFGRPVVITGQDFRFVVAEQLQELGIEADIILEPERRDSAAAVAVATEFVARREPDAVLLIMPADHLVRDAESFAAGCIEAAKLAERGLIMTLGISPDSPATGYGYICPGKGIDGTGGNVVDRFVEKPDAVLAAKYVAEGYLWNSGYFLFRAQVMRDELLEFAPAILNAAIRALDAARSDLDFVRLDAQAFATAPKTSIDYAVMEKTNRAGVVPVDCGWSDVGSWGAVWEVSDRDSEGNVTRGRTKLVATRNSLVHADGVLAGVVGVNDVVVVASRDAVLVTSRSRAGEVKDLVAALRADGEPEADAHLRIHRPWGWYQRIDIGPRFQVKRIMVKPGARLSLQKHLHRAEHWVVVSGTAEVTVDDRVWTMGENESAYLPLGCIHRLVNPGKLPLEIVEVQVGSYTGEDDIVRIEDIYGR